MSSNKKNHDGEKDNKKGGFIDNTDKNHLTPNDPAQNPESKYWTSSTGTSIQSENVLSRGGNNNRESVNNSYGDGGDRPRSNPTDNQSDRGK